MPFDWLIDKLLIEVTTLQQGDGTMPREDKPYVITYVSPVGSRGVFYKPTLDLAIDKIADLTCAPHTFRINRTGSHSYLVEALRDVHAFT